MMMVYYLFSQDFVPVTPEAAKDLVVAVEIVYTSSKTNEKDFFFIVSFVFLIEKSK